MAQARIGWEAQGQGEVDRGWSRETKQRAMYVLAAVLMGSGALLLVLAFVAVLSDRGDSLDPEEAVITELAGQIEDAKLGCHNFTIGVSRTRQVLSQGTCASSVGSLRIVLYRNPAARTFVTNLTRSYVCDARAASGNPIVLSVIRKDWAVDTDSSDPESAQAIRRAVGGRVTSYDCAAPPPPPTTVPPETAPPAEAPPAEIPPAEAPPAEAPPAEAPPAEAPPA